MKKTHSANIGGTVFAVEEDAYEKLQAYLQSIEMHFRTYPDVAEIVADIEGRIAEQLMQREMAPAVVRMVDVDRVIAAMGRTQDFSDSPAGTEGQSGQVPASEGRKLFRDPDNKVIAGVAAGLAAYLGLPRLFVRIVLVVLLAVFGTALVVYLLLWALVPTANSTTEKLQMRGRPLTLDSIDQGIRDSAASIPRATRSMAAGAVNAMGSLIHLVVVTIARAIRWVASVVIVGSATLGILVFTVLLVIALVNAGTLDEHIAEFFALFGAWQHVLKVFFYLLAAIPLALVITTALRLFWNVRHLNSRGLAGLLGAWVIALLASAAVWSSNSMALRQFMDELPAKEAARSSVERFRVVAATASPLSDEQAQALFTTLLPEKKRLDKEYGQGGPRPWWDHAGYAQRQEQWLASRQESNRRVIEVARSYLDAQQLAALKAHWAQDIARGQADLQDWRAHMELACSKCTNHNPF